MPKTKDTPRQESIEEDEEEVVSDDTPSVQDEDTRKVAHEEHVMDSHQNKRRKLSGKCEDTYEEGPTPDAEESNIPLDSKLPSQGSLPSFPVPAAPNALSKYVLAMQGIDKALVHAEIINAAAVLPILPSGVDERTKLSERTRKRLLELGITCCTVAEGHSAMSVCEGRYPRQSVLSVMPVRHPSPRIRAVYSTHGDR